MLCHKRSRAIAQVGSKDFTKVTGNVFFSLTQACASIESIHSLYIFIPSFKCILYTDLFCCQYLENNSSSEHFLPGFERLFQSKKIQNK